MDPVDICYIDILLYGDLILGVTIMCYAIRTLINGSTESITIHDENSMEAMEPYIRRTISTLPHDKFVQVMVYRCSLLDNFSRHPLTPS